MIQFPATVATIDPSCIKPAGFHNTIQETKDGERSSRQNVHEDSLREGAGYEVKSDKQAEIKNHGGGAVVRTLRKARAMKMTPTLLSSC